MGDEHLVTSHLLRCSHHGYQDFDPWQHCATSSHSGARECDVSAGCWAVSVPYPHCCWEATGILNFSLADGVRYLILAFVQFDGEPLAEPGCPDVPVTVAVAVTCAVRSPI